MRRGSSQGAQRFVRLELDLDPKSCHRSWEGGDMHEDTTGTSEKRAYHRSMVNPAASELALRSSHTYTFPGAIDFLSSGSKRREMIGRTCLATA